MHTMQLEPKLWVDHDGVQKEKKKSNAHNYCNNELLQ